MGYLGDDFSGNSGLNSSSWQWKLTIHNDDREHLKTEGAETTAVLISQNCSHQLLLWESEFPICQKYQPPLWKERTKSASGSEYDDILSLLFVSNLHKAA